MDAEARNNQGCGPDRSPREELYIVGGVHDGVRLDRFLVDRLGGRSRASIQRLIEEGGVLLNGRAVTAHHKVRPGDRVALAVPPPRETEVPAEEIPLKVLYEDDDFLVVDKPAGMVVHPAGRIVRGTLVNALLARCTDLSGVGGELKPGIVHRLDRGTSGCIAVAKNDRSHLALSAQFARREVMKEYLAIVHGTPPRERGSIEGLIGRHPVDRKKMAVRRDRGRRAVTRFEVVERFPAHALVKVMLATGRTHQIRVQMAHLGLPVLGDAVYGRKKEQRIGGLEIGRPMLHAWRLGFVHPRTGRDILVEAPVPEDFTCALRQLRSMSGVEGAGERARGTA